VWSINYKDDEWDIIGGLSLQNFEGNHFGYVTYLSDSKLRSLLMKMATTSITTRMRKSSTATST
jgi:hypothetical protein